MNNYDLFTFRERLYTIYYDMLVYNIKSMKTSAGNIKKGDFTAFDSDIYQVIKIEHNFRGRGQANLKFKLKGLKTGNTIEKTYGPDNSVEWIDVDTVEVHYLYQNAGILTFMNNQTYEQYELKAEVIGDFAKYLKEGQSIYILLHDGQALSIRPPHTVKLKVIEAHDAVKGDTASGAKKIVKLETGVTISVPLFIKKGDIISVNPETGEYLERTS